MASMHFPEGSAGASYRQAGVDIEAGDQLVEQIKPLARATKRAGVMGGLGGFGAMFDLKAAGYTDPVLVSATDGVGTKLLLAIETGLHATVGIDLVAMCVNDLIVQGAEPLFFLDYFATGQLEPAQAQQVIAGIAEGCRRAGCALVGGETAEMPGLYGKGHYDLAGFAVGAAERDRMLPAGVQPGDILIGLGASGVHSNGFSLVRHILKQAGLSWDSAAPFQSGVSLGEALLTPTKIYVRSLLALHKAGLLKAAAHITGGGLPGNLPRVLPENTVAVLEESWTMPPVFQWLATLGKVATDEMLKVFNCGVGMVVVTQNEQAALTLLREQGEDAFVLGRIEHAEGPASVRIAKPPFQQNAG